VQWPRITAEQLHAVCKPLFCDIDFGHEVAPHQLEGALRAAALGPVHTEWQPPDWLMPHQVQAARRARASLLALRGALVADAVGLGKTYVALAIAMTYETATAVVPAAIQQQWRRACGGVGATVSLLSHEALSRGCQVAPTDLLIVDEAHRFRNPKTRRYDTLARAVKLSHVLLLTATPVVNRAADLVNLLRLFAADHAFALFGASSLEAATGARTYHELGRATAPAIVARSRTTLETASQLPPAVRDGAIMRPPPVAPGRLVRLLRMTDALEFPSTSEQHEAALLRLHLLFRLASSATAFRQTVRNHLVYIERALQEARSGNQLSRAWARRIFGSEYELQLQLRDLTERQSLTNMDLKSLNRERDRLSNLLEELPSRCGAEPKAAVLARLIKRRQDHKTIVFTAAVATALALAHSLTWHRVAVVGAGKGWIASGRIPVEEALALFAPKARGMPEPHPAARVTTLVATDFASEGLDLQDADGVVHYDLPWTPLTLEQRIGRVVRLGSEHGVADVCWFAPPHPLERRLQIEARLAEKARCQLGIGVPATTLLGKGHVINVMLETRERLGSWAVRAASGTCPAFSVVKGPLAAALAIRWSVDSNDIPELIVLHNQPLQLASDYALADTILRQLLAAKRSPTGPPQELVAGFLKVVRRRLADFDVGPVNPAARQLGRRIMGQAYLAGGLRDCRRLDMLDRLLDRVHAGLTVGGERELARLLAAHSNHNTLNRCLDELPPGRKHRPTLQVLAALFGDGTARAAT